MGENMNATSVSTLPGLNDLSFLRFGALKCFRDSSISLLIMLHDNEGIEKWQRGGTGSYRMDPEETTTTPSMSLQKQMCKTLNLGTGFHRVCYTHIEDNGKQTGGAFKMHYTLFLPAPGCVQTGSVLVITAGCSCCLALACGRYWPVITVLPACYSNSWDGGEGPEESTSHTITC